MIVTQYSSCIHANDLHYISLPAFDSIATLVIMLFLVFIFLDRLPVPVVLSVEYFEGNCLMNHLFTSVQDLKFDRDLPILPKITNYLVTL